MTNLNVVDHNQNSVAQARRSRTLGAALAELALTVSLILSIAVILVAAGASGAMAATRSDLIMVEESLNSTFTTLGIVSVIIVVMGVLTILALRDVAPAHSKRGARRHTTPTVTRR